MLGTHTRAQRFFSYAQTILRYPDGRFFRAIGHEEFVLHNSRGVVSERMCRVIILMHIVSNKVTSGPSRITICVRRRLHGQSWEKYCLCSQSVSRSVRFSPNVLHSDLESLRRHRRLCSVVIALVINLHFAFIIPLRKQYGFLEHMLTF